MCDENSEWSLTYAKTSAGSARTATVSEYVFMEPYQCLPGPRINACSVNIESSTGPL